jgi:hypothetical protein
MQVHLIDHPSSTNINNISTYNQVRAQSNDFVKLMSKFDYVTIFLVATVINKLTFTDKLTRFAKTLFKDVTTSTLRHKMPLSLNGHNQTFAKTL